MKKNINYDRILYVKMVFVYVTKIVKMLKLRSVINLLRESNREYKIIESYKSRNVKICEGCRFYLDSEIGEYTYIGRYCDITRAKIGRYCSIGNFVVIGGGEHRTDRISTNIALYPDSEKGFELADRELIIKNDVWIGTNAVIRRGVTIGNGAVIGANSFVNKDVPDYAIVAGVPARIIRYRFPDNVIKEILESQWWEKDKTEAIQIINELEAKFSNP